VPASQLARRLSYGQIVPWAQSCMLPFAPLRAGEQRLAASAFRSSCILQQVRAPPDTHRAGRRVQYEAGSAPAIALEATMERTNKRFDNYAKSGVLCGSEGLPHLIADPGFALRFGHAGEIFVRAPSLPARLPESAVERSAGLRSHAFSFEAAFDRLPWRSEPPRGSCLHCSRLCPALRASSSHVPPQLCLHLLSSCPMRPTDLSLAACLPHDGLCT
jgi:Photosystem I reaction centre subunit III